MATHKVPQDVEAEDKLVGFLSLKQFIMTILGLGFGYLTFVFFVKVHPVASVIWIPFTLVFLVLGLYQRKDQPVEVYLASALRYYIKPRRRKWNQEGYEERVIITAPPKIERRYTKNFTGEEASSHLGNLSRLMDSRGWTTKLAGDWQNPQLATAAASDRLVQPGDLRTSGIDLAAYTQPVDVMDEQSSIVAQDFQARITQTDSSVKQHALEAVKQAQQTADDASSVSSRPQEVVPHYQKYPAMHQKVVPTTQEQTAAQKPPEKTTVTEVPKAVIQNAPEPQIREGDDGVEIKLH